MSPLNPVSKSLEPSTETLNTAHRQEPPPAEGTLDTKGGAAVPAAKTASIPLATPTMVGRDGRYRVLRAHAKGGLGEVFLALDSELNREVALKEIQTRFADETDSRTRFVLEAEVTGRLEHPGIVPVYGLGAYANGRPYYAMRFIKGDSFQDAIARFHDAEKPGRDPGERALAFRELLRRFNDVCNAIAYAHSKGVLHRDLKPANIMLGRFGETLVVDWGLAKVRGEAEAAVEGSAVLKVSGSGSETQDGTAIGTPAYMSPEQAAGRINDLTEATDIYGLGAILYTVLTGKPPFGKSMDVFALLMAVRAGYFAKPRAVQRSIPAALEAVCLKAMALQPEDRYATAKDLAADIEHWLADEPVTAYREPFTFRVRRWGRRHRTLVTSAAALVLTATAALAVGLVLVNAERSRTATARDHERRAKEAEQQANVGLTAALGRETKLKGDLERANGGLKTALSRETKLKGDLERANGGLKTALSRETKLKGDLEIALKSASEQRKLALATMKDVVKVFDARLKDFPGLQDLRKELLDRAMKGLQKVARAADISGQIDHETVWVHFELGDILLRIDGATKEAKKEYDLALQLSQKLADADPRNAQAQRDLSVAHDNLGNVQLQLGDTKAALEDYRAALVIRQKLADADPRNTQAQRDLSVSHNKLGDVQLQLGDTQAAREDYRTALVIRQKLADADPRNAQAQRDLSVSHNKLGDVQLQLGDTQAAREDYRAGLAISQKLADADPRNTKAQRDLLVSFSKLGDVAQKFGEFRQAADWYAKALDVPKRLDKPEFFAKEVRILEPFPSICRDAAAVFDDLDALSKVPEDRRSAVLTVVMNAHVRSKQPDKAVAAADLLARNAKQAGDVYNAACGYACCVPLAAKPDTKEQYATRAVALLKQAVARGYKDAAHIKKDTDLDALRERADFKALLKELETKPPDASKDK